MVDNQTKTVYNKIEHTVVTFSKLFKQLKKGK
jgi:hypothetical protein